MKIIFTKKGEEIIVDKDTYEILNKRKWYIGSDGYAYTHIPDNECKNRKISMHRFIMNAPKGVMVDHINGNKLDNRKENLRVCNNKENQRNRKTNKNKIYSNYKGVRYDKRRNVYYVSVWIEQKPIHIGTFKNEIAAANCYNYHAKKLFGEFAKLNNVPFMDKEKWEKERLKNHGKYIGVSKSRNKWRVYVWHNKQKVYAGTYDTEIEAAKAYNKKVIELKGENAKLNIIEEASNNE